MTLEGRVALVTGGGRGIGRAISLALAEGGARIAVNYHRDADAAEETVAAIEARGGHARAYQASVTDRDAVNSMAATVADELGPIGVLVSNAGQASRGKSVAGTDPAEIRAQLEVHALGPYWLCQAVVRPMRELDRGDIVMISSVATEHMAGYGSPYNMGKAALEALAMTLAKEEAAHGIRVNVVAPGLVDTEMGRRLVKATAQLDDIRVLDEHMPLGRVCAPEDVAAVVRFLVSDAGGYVTGARIKVDGGGMPSR